MCLPWIWNLIILLSLAWTFCLPYAQPGILAGLYIGIWRALSGASLQKSYSWIGFIWIRSFLTAMRFFVSGFNKSFEKSLMLVWLWWNAGFHSIKTWSWKGWLFHPELFGTREFIFAKEMLLPFHETVENYNEVFSQVRFIFIMLQIALASFSYWRHS